MPTIKQIADKCGVTKPTVTAKLKELNLWDSHVNKKGNAFYVSDDAASAVASALTSSIKTKMISNEKEKIFNTTEDIYEAYISDLKKTNEKLWEQLKEKDDLIAELTRKIAEQNKPSIWKRLLPEKHQ